MAGIRSKNTKPEILIRKALHSSGYRFRLGSKVDSVRPDVVLRSRKIAIFAHGCYWHQHPGCKLAYSNRKYSEEWQKKFADNRNRDQRVEKQLLADDWRVAVFWECATRSSEIFVEEFSRLQNWIESEESGVFETRYKRTLKK